MLFETSLEFLNVFVEPPGNTLFFLVVMLLSVLSAGMIAGQRHRTVTIPGRRRYLVALFGVLLALLILAGGALFALLSGQSDEAILPPLERAVMAVCVLLLGWAFVRVETHNPRQAYIALLVSLLAVAGGYTVTGVQWAGMVETGQGVAEFNATGYAIAWALALSVMSLAGALATLFYVRQVRDAPLKFVFFSVLLTGYGATAYLTWQGSLTGNYAGVSRLAFALAFTLVPVLLYRLIQMQYRQALQDAEAAVASGAGREVDTPRHTVDMQSVQLLKSLGMILEDATPERIPAKIVQTSLDMLHADLGALLRIKDANYADIEEAYDRVMQRQPAGMSLNLKDQPTLVTAFDYRKQRSLFPDKRPGELDDLYTRFDVEQRGPAYFQPLTHRGDVIAVLLIAYPYTRRELRPDEIELLKGVAIIASNLLALSYEAREARNLAEELTVQAMVDGVPLRHVQESDVLAARREMQESLQLARDQIDHLSQQVSRLEMELDSERQRLMGLLGDSEEDLSLSQRIRAITADQEHLRDERNRLMKRVQKAEAALNGAVTPSDDALAQQVLQQVQREKESLETERDRLQAQLDDLRAQDKTVMPEEMQTMLNRMLQEKTRLETERNQLSDRLDTIRGHLREAGIGDEDTAITQLIQRLYEERTALVEDTTRLQRERDMLLNDRQRIAGTVSQDKDREARIQTLEQDVEHLAADREAALKQRQQWRTKLDDMRDQLNVVKEHRAQLLAQVSAFEMDLQDAHDAQTELRAQVQQLADEKSHLIDERDRLRATLQTVTTERNQLMAGIDGDPARLKAVNQEGVGALRQMVDDLSAERDRLANELHITQNKLAEVEQRQTMAALASVANGNGATYHPDQPELLVGLVQELRTPMTSISGYVDLLLNESAGILGEKQRKFMHRVAANIQRLDSMIDSLVNITELDTGTYRLKPHPVDVVHLVEEAITNAALQFREKGLAVNLQIDDTLPRLPADEDAVRQIIGQLLTNAYLASPADSSITVTVERREMRLQPDTVPRACLYVAIADRGGGIMPEDVPRVFARKYRAENPLIDGLGDTGVGMSIAQTLVEAHEGHLWVESKLGRGTVFSFAIPLDLTLAVESD